MKGFVMFSSLELTFLDWYYALGEAQATEEALKIDVPIDQINEWLDKIPALFVSIDWS